MSTSKGRMQDAGWREVTTREPCPVCRHDGWCRVSPDGKWALCRRESQGSQDTTTYADGTTAYRHLLRDDPPSANGKQRQPQPAGSTASSEPTPAADADTRDRAYRLLLAELKLSQAHRDNLRARGLTDEQIDGCEYRTLTGSEGPEVALKVCYALGNDKAGGIPGLTPTRILSAPGLLIPVRDLAGRIVALRIRPDDPGDCGKYRYLSSRNRQRPNGASPGSPAHVPAGIVGPCPVVRITEGELKADAAWRLSGVPTVSFPGVQSWRAVLAVLQELRAQAVRVAFDADASSNANVARSLRECVETLAAGGYSVELERWNAAAGKGIDDLLLAGGTPEVLTGPDAVQAVRDIATAAGVQDDGDGSTNGQPTKGNDAAEEKKSQATLLVELAAAAELWHTPGHGDGYATITVDGHREHWPVRSKAFRRWLARRFFVENEKAPGGQALQDAITVIEGQALFDGEEWPTSLRVGGNDGRLYLDLADAHWRAVEIDAGGWRVVDSCPVRFRRAKAMQALPIPTTGGRLDDLRQFVNVTDDDWPLLLGWLVATLRPTGPYPILALHGEQGSAKTTTAKLLRAIIDPNAAPVRCEPREPRDLMIAATNGWVVAFDNLSHIPSWLSDALCRLSTGGGFSTRTLYENDEETIFDATRPVILTGIEEVATRSDLLDRCVIINLPTIPEGRRLPESQFWPAVEAALPGILGAVLDAVAAAVCNLASTSLQRLPRMADFALWATAAEPGLGLRAGEFIEAYAGNRAVANEQALESSPVATYILQLVQAGDWEGTSSDLLDKLDAMATDKCRAARNWPKSPRGLSGIVKRLAPNLRAAGVDIEFGHAGRGKDKRRWLAIGKVRETCVPTVPIVPTREIPESNGDASGDAKPSGDANQPCGDAAGTQNRIDVNPCPAMMGTHGDDGDAKFQPCSNDDQWGEV